MYNIDANVPVSGSFGACGRPRKYPFDELGIGDSFFVPGKRRNAIVTSVEKAEHRTGFSFVSRNHPDGVRVWRES